MQDDQPPGDKPHDPTPRKLEEARKKGEIVRSADLNTAVVYAGFLLAGVTLGPWATQQIGGQMRGLLGRADSVATLLLSPGGTAAAGGVLTVPVQVFVAAVGVPAGVLLAALIAQRGLLFTPSKLAPKLSRIDPVANAKQKFGAEGLFQFAKSAIKLLVISGLLAFYLAWRAEHILSSLYAAPGQILAALGWLSFEFLAVVTGLAALIAVIDWSWEWRQHQAKNRMSRQELMDETKTSEGDPQMRQQRRQRAQAIAMNQMLADVPKADVVIVNPTHFAVALAWDRSGGAVPVCVAKGVNEIARRIREVAAEAAVPVFSDPPTARALHASIEIGAPIAPDHFRAVAAAIRFADLMRQKVARR